MPRKPVEGKKDELENTQVLSADSWDEKVNAAKLVAEKVLNEKKIYKWEDRLKAKEIYDNCLEKKYFDNIKTIFPTLDLFRPCLSFAVNMPGSIITRLEGSHGYFLSKAQEIVIKLEKEAKEEAEKKSEDKEEVKEREKEQILYPSLERWLQNHGLRARDTSQIKKLGKWGSPDVTGIKKTEYLNMKEIEITSIEAKTSIKNWEIDIFEAIAHLRYVSRAYFAFAHPASGVSKISEDVRYYCELYGIGLIIVAMSDDLYNNFINGEVKKIDEDDDFTIIEYRPAPLHYVPMEWQKFFLEKIGISESDHLVTWGNAPTREPST